MNWILSVVGHASSRATRPALSIEITRECPLHCPGCYAYGDEHLGGDVTLREVRDFKGQELVDGVLELVDRHRPLHVSIVGGEPLVRYRELNTLLPDAVRSAASTCSWSRAPCARSRSSGRDIPRLSIVVSIDGLQPEHDARRTPATYDRILKHIAGHQITVHCTITRQQVNRPGYIDEFLALLVGAAGGPEDLVQPVHAAGRRGLRGTAHGRRTAQRVVADLRALRLRYPEAAGARRRCSTCTPTPPESPDECVFARMTTSVSADLTTKITPCQFGGTPDCANCGCMASAGLAAIARHRVLGVVPVGAILNGSMKVGAGMRRLRPAAIS